MDLRLTNSSVTMMQDSIIHEGNIEICIDGMFAGVCDEGWDDVDAQVACNLLGFPSPLYRKFVWSFDVLNNLSGYYV